MDDPFASPSCPECGGDGEVSGDGFHRLVVCTICDHTWTVERERER